MFRAHYMTFSGRFRGTHEQEHHLHESPSVMTAPLWILAAGAVFAGLVGVPKLLSMGFDLNWFHHFLGPILTEEHGLGTGVEVFLVLLAVAAGLGGLVAARSIYGGENGLEKGRAWAERFPAVHRLLVNKYYVDELYDAVIVKPLAWLSRVFWKGVDAFLIDGAIHVGAYLTELTGDIGRFSTTGNVRTYALYFFLGVVALFWWIAFG
jgi:NADH-quinone oxidoreductase subunit L